MKKQGFTIVEILIVVAISGVFLSGAYKFYISQVKSYQLNSQLSELDENMRASLGYMSENIMMAGYAPALPGAAAGASFGFVLDFSSPNNNLGATTNQLVIAFTIDNNQDGVVNANDLEMFAYRLYDGVLQSSYINDSGNLTWVTLAENIDALNFIYFDKDGNRLIPPFNPITLAKIRRVDITIVGRSSSEDTAFTDTKAYYNQLLGTTGLILSAQNDHHHRRSLTCSVQSRNTGM